MRLSVVAGVYALWLVATEILFYSLVNSGRIDETSLAIGVLLGLVPAATQLLLLGVNPFGLNTPVRMALVFVLIVLLSYFGQASWNSFIYLLLVLFVFGVTLLVAGSPDPRLLRSIAVLYSLPAAGFLIYVSITGERFLGRLVAHDIQPNWWGLMGLALAMAGFAHRSRLLMAACLAVGLFIAYDASSRSSMLAIGVATVAIGLVQLRAFRGQHIVAGLAVVVSGLVLWMMYSTAISNTISGVLVDAFRIDDPFRGTGSGFTGRENVWAEVIRIWLTSPLFGVGYHQHQIFTTDHAEAHQAYLAALADTGVLGFFWYLAFLLSSLYAALRLEDMRTRNFAVASIISYAVIGLFEAHGISGGNPSSLFFQMCCFFALAQASLRRAAGALSPWAAAARLKP